MGDDKGHTKEDLLDALPFEIRNAEAVSAEDLVKFAPVLGKRLIHYYFMDKIFFYYKVR